MSTRNVTGFTLERLITQPVMSEVTVQPLTGMELPIANVRLIERLDQILDLRPETIVVLSSGLADSPWAVSIALRYAWERNLRCVICSLDNAAAPQSIHLAQHLRVPLGIFSGSMADLALKIASLLGSSETSRSRTLSAVACETAIAKSEDDVLRTLDRNLPGVHVSLERPGQKSSALESGQNLVRVPFGESDFTIGRSIVAVVEHNSDEWSETVRLALMIARPALITCGVRQHLISFRKEQVETWMLSRLVNGDCTDQDVQEAGAVLGWEDPARVVAAKLLAPDVGPEEHDRLSASLRASWDHPGAAAPVPFEDGWAIWLAVSGDEESDVRDDPFTLSAELAEFLSETFEGLSLATRIVAGVGTESTGVNGLASSLRLASLAANYAALRTDMAIVEFDKLAGGELAVITIQPELTARVLEWLAPILHSDEPDLLVETLARFLDSGGSPTRTAEAMGLHRNTVAGRLERIRGLGIDAEDPALRLILHIASHLALAHVPHRESGKNGHSG